MAGVGKVKTTITWTGILAEVANLKSESRLEARFLNKVVKPSMNEALKWWHKNRYPLRFTTTQYAKKNRATEYNRRKQRIQGHRQPLVFTGELRNLTVGSSNANVVSRRLRGRGVVKGEVRLRGARKVNQMRRSKREQIRKELFSLLAKDEQVLNDRIEKNVVKNWASIRRSQRRRRVSK